MTIDDLKNVYIPLKRMQAHNTCPVCKSKYKQAKIDGDVVVYEHEIKGNCVFPRIEKRG